MKSRVANEIYFASPSSLSADVVSQLELNEPKSFQPREFAAVSIWYKGGGEVATIELVRALLYGQFETQTCRALVEEGSFRTHPSPRQERLTQTTGSDDRERGQK